MSYISKSTNIKVNATSVHYRTPCGKGFFMVEVFFVPYAKILAYSESYDGKRLVQTPSALTLEEFTFFLNDASERRSNARPFGGAFPPPNPETGN